MEIIVALIMAGVPTAGVVWQVIRQGKQTRGTLTADHSKMRELVEDLSRDVKITVIPTLHEHGRDIAKVQKKVNENAEIIEKYQDWAP